MTTSLTPEPTPTREVVVADTAAWLDADDGAPARNRQGWSVVSSIPDISETGQSDTVWRSFFGTMAGRLMQLVDGDGLLVLFQTDTRSGGVWLDKGALITNGVVAAGGVLVARKIICRRPPGTTSSRRAAYTNLLVFGWGPLDQSHPDTVADVIDDGGPVTWTRGVGLYGARAAMAMVKRYARSTHTVVDPFCGEGMLLAAANEAGLHSLGVERHRKRAEAARRLRTSALRGDAHSATRPADGVGANSRDGVDDDGVDNDSAI